jgi:hypothetical protein
MAWIVVVRCCALSIALALAGGVALAQGQKPATRTTQVIVAQRNSRIVSLLEQLADQALTSENLTFAVRAQTQAASLLWSQDPARARAIYQRAFQSLVPGTSSKSREAGDSDAARASSLRSSSTAEKLQLRSELLNQIAARDPELAEELARSLGDNSDGSKAGCVDGFSAECSHNGSGSTRPSNATPGGRIHEDAARRELLMSAALQVVDRDPQQAMAFAQMSVALGVSSNLARLLTIMRGLDSERADLLFSNAMARLERSSQVDLTEVHTLGSYVVSVVNSGSKQPLSRPLVLRFLDFAFDQFTGREQAIARGSKREDSPALYFVGRQLTDLFQRYLPYRLNQLQRYVGDQSDSGSYEDGIDPSLLKIKSASDIARAAIESSDPVERDSLYARAALSWLTQGDLKEAQSCALKITDAATRDRVLVQVVRRHSSEKRIEDAVVLTRRISDETARVELLVMLSGAARASMGDVRSAELLNEAGACSLKARPSVDRARSLVMIASSFAAFDTTRSFEFFQSAIKAIEDTTKQDDSKDEPNVSGARTRAAQSVALDVLYAASFESTLTVLAKADFEGALALARQLPGEEASVIAQLAVCRGGLVETTLREHTTTGEEADSGLNH